MKKIIGLISANYIVEDLEKCVRERAVAALPFGSRYRLIDFPLSNMKNAGINTVGIIMPFNNRSLIDHVGTGKAWGFGRKTNSLFMLPGSVYGKRNNTDKFLLRDLIMNFRFIEYDHPDYVVICGVNTIWNMDLRQMIDQHEKSGCNMTVGVKNLNGTEIPLDCVVMNGSFLIDVATWFSNLDFLGVRTIINDYLGDDGVEKYEFDGEVITIRDMSDYLKANLSLLDREVQKELFPKDRQIYTNVQDRAPTFYTPSAKVKNSLVAAGCVIEGEVENSVIFRSSTIRKGAVVKNSVLMQHCNVGEGAYLNNFVCDKRVSVTENVHVEGTEKSPYFAQKGQIV